MNTLIDYMAIVVSIINLGTKKLSRDAQPRKFAERVLQLLGSTIAVYVCLSAGVKSKEGRRGSSGREAGRLTLAVATAGCLLAVSDLPLLCFFFSLLNTDILCCLKRTTKKNAHTYTQTERKRGTHIQTHTKICINPNTRTQVYIAWWVYISTWTTCIQVHQDSKIAL